MAHIYNVNEKDAQRMNKNMKGFFGVKNDDTESNYNRNVTKFFGGDKNGNKQENGDGFMNVQNNVDVKKDSEFYKRNTHNFFGEMFDDSKSQGSIYQQNK